MSRNGSSLHIGWYARDGYVDFFPMIAARLKDMGISAASYFACNHSVDEERLRLVYGIPDAWVVAHYLHENEHGFDTTDEGISRLQETFPDRPLISCLWADMFIIGKLSEEDLKRNLVGHFAFWDAFLSENKIDILVSEIPSILSICVGWLVCKTRGVEFLAFRGVPHLRGRTAITTSFEAWYDDLEIALRDTSDDTVIQNLATALVDEIRRTGLKKETWGVPVKQQNILFDKTPLSASGFLRSWRRTARESEYYVSPKPIDRLRRRVSQTLKQFMIPKLGVFDRPTELSDRHYVIFPLHQPGEWSLFPNFGLAISDPLLTIREIVNCLPLGYRLYVKEHTALFGLRGLGFYREAKRYKRLRLIDPFSDVSELIQDAQAIVTYGSTLGFEAFLAGKPVILLARAWYHMLPGVYYADTPEKLAQLLQQSHELPVANSSQVEECVRALLSISFEGRMNPPSVMLSSDNVDRFADALAKRLEAKAAQPIRP